MLKNKKDPSSIIHGKLLLTNMFFSNPTPQKITETNAGKK